MTDQERDVSAPDPVLTNRRWVSPATVEWVKQCNEILLDKGSVHGARSYSHRHQARWRSTKLINLMVRLDMHERWNLKERTYKAADGWKWAVEYVKGDKR